MAPSHSDVLERAQISRVMSSDSELISQDLGPYQAVLAVGTVLFDELLL